MENNTTNNIQQTKPSGSQATPDFDMVEYHIICGKHATKAVLLDKEDYEKVKIFRWHGTMCKGKIYVCKSTPSSGKYKSIKLHRFILGLSDDSSLVDHINGNTLDNRRCNLRTASYSQNGVNRLKRSKSKTGYTGIRDFYNKRCKTKRYNAYFSLQLNGKKKYINLGFYQTCKEALVARNNYGVGLYGDFYNQQQYTGEPNNEL